MPPTKKRMLPSKTKKRNLQQVLTSTIHPGFEEEKLPQMLTPECNSNHHMNY